MSGYKIDRDVPLPYETYHYQYKPKRRASSTYPFNDLAIGDSFLVPSGDPREKSVRAASSVCGIRWGKRFVTRVAEEGTRIWRAE